MDDWSKRWAVKRWANSAHSPSSRKSAQLIHAAGKHTTGSLTAVVSHAEKKDNLRREAVCHYRTRSKRRVL
jgi:hypothetical protein